MNWYDVYSSGFQSLWALIAIPLAFLTFVCVVGSKTERSRQDHFITSFCLIWTVETLLDPIVGGPVAKALGLSEGLSGSAILFLFVYLGDLRVFVLLFGLVQEHALKKAAAFALIIPALTGVLYGAATLWDPQLSSQWMWLIYELGFLGMAIWLVRRWVPQHCGEEQAGLRDMLSSCGAYVATYYALWASSDILILLGFDEGWGLRLLPNQLYYALWIPFVYVRYWSTRDR